MFNFLYGIFLFTLILSQKRYKVTHNFVSELGATYSFGYKYFNFSTSAYGLISFLMVYFYKNIFIVNNQFLYPVLVVGLLCFLLGWFPMDTKEKQHIIVSGLIYLNCWYTAILGLITIISTN